MDWEFCGVQWEDMGEENWKEGFNRKKLVKRSEAFKHIMFPSTSKKLKDIKDSPLPYDVKEKLATSTLKKLKKQMKPLVSEIKESQHAKAFHVLRESFVDFLDLNRIKPICGKEIVKVDNKKH